ncbi:recombination protein NinB, partial [Pasteurella bettyae]|uniref:recombination protein NinB n=1 Tax=Pasteurella bettyae TaxID=752 RepID=UPI003D2CFC31
IGLEGEVINLRESTAQMGVKRLASLIEYLTVWGVENGVHFNDKFNFWGHK